jgi:putative transposase
MPDYRRVIIPGGTFFFTVVTWQRQPIFTQEFARHALYDAFEQTRERFPFVMDAVCLLPDHLHCIWTLPDGDSDYPTRWRFLKTMFTYRFHTANPATSDRSGSRIARREAAIWQRRFWEHLIQDEEDFGTHVEYIHNNPIKHGLVERAEDWPWSSYHRWNP